MSGYARHLEPTADPALAPCTETAGKVLTLKNQMPDLAVLQARDPTAAARLLGT